MGRDSHLIFIGAANHIEIEIDATFIDHCQPFQQSNFTLGRKQKLNGGRRGDRTGVPMNSWGQLCGPRKGQLY